MSTLFFPLLALIGALGMLSLRRGVRALALVLFLVAACGPGPTPTSVPSAVPIPTPPPIATPSTVPSTASPTATPGETPEPARLPGEPDYTLTPGVLNPNVTPATIGSTICVSGWTATIRPPTSYTNPLKVKQIGQYGYTDTNVADYEEDHLIPLELGGSPTDPGNLWPEPRTDSYNGHDTGAAVKDGLESKYKTEVCAGTLTLAQAQADIGDNWVHVYLGVAP